MVTNSIDHGDLFDAMEPGAGSVAAAVPDAPALPLIAIPCGFSNRHNVPCRRLGSQPVTIDGKPFHHRACRIVHCDPACFRGGVADVSGGEPVSDGQAGGEAGPIG